MVPFHNDPGNVEVGEGTYPKADASASYSYETTVSLKLCDAFAKFGANSMI